VLLISAFAIATRAMLVRLARYFAVSYALANASNMDTPKRRAD